MNDVQDPLRALDGVRVIEVGQLLAGPFAGTMLGYYGAEIIKVEPPGGGDPIRQWRAVRNGTSLWWAGLARNKKCVTLNLREDEGRKLLGRLIEQADVVIENFRPGTMEKWGLGPEAFKQSNPGLIYARISGYGQTGPYAPRPGFASVCEGFGGFRYVNGFPGQPPVRPNLSIGDTLAGLHAMIGVLLALISRGRDADGAGQIIDVSIFESVFNLLEAVVSEYDGAGIIREPSGSTLTGIVPSNTYRCANDKLIVIGANTESMFQRLCEAMGRQDLSSDERYGDNASRVSHQDELDGIIGAWTASMPAAEILQQLEAAGVASGPIYSVADMMDDPQYQARGLFEDVLVDGEPLKIPALVPQLSHTPGRTEWPGPAVGSHNDEIYRDLLALDEQALAMLRQRGVI